MKNILILGAGLIARPLLHHLLSKRDYRLLVGTLDLPRAEKLLAGHPNARAMELRVEDVPVLTKYVAEADIVVSLLPAPYNPQVARVVLDQGKSLINTSYVAPAMAELDEEARRRGVLLLNEIGLDPGIDHMSAVRVIDRLKAAGGTMTQFTSCCGGFPAPEANTNPWGYKFSWTPRGVFVAGRNAARWLRNGELAELPGPELFTRHWDYGVEGQRVFEMYPNRDALQYIDPYGLQGVKGIFRGTLRYPGWCETMLAAVKLGLLDLDEQDWPAGSTYADLLLRRVPAGSGSKVARLAEYLGLSPDSAAISRLEWAGLLSDRPIPERRAAPLDVFANRMGPIMQYGPGERDMVVLRHTFSARFDDGRTEHVVSSLVETGIPHGDTAMARTVSLPAAIATDLCLRGEIRLAGVHIPIVREVYQPVLDELEAMGIGMRETETTSYPGPLC